MWLVMVVSLVGSDLYLRFRYRERKRETLKMEVGLVFVLVIMF